MTFAIGVDLGGTKTAAARVWPDGTVGDVLTAPTPARLGPTAVFDQVAELVRLLDPADAVGIGAAGVVDSLAGRVIHATETLSGWVGADIPGQLRSRLDLPAMCPLEVRNDVDAHALGEAWLGAARGHGSMLLVAVGTGVGGSVVLNGRLWTGARSVAGEIGHFPTPGAESDRCACGRFGHLEGIAAGAAIERYYRYTTGESVGGREIMVRAEAGEEAALSVVSRAATALGKAITGLVSFIDPACVVIGGGIAQAGAVWWDPLLKSCHDDLMGIQRDIPIVPAELGPTAAIAGAAPSLRRRRRLTAAGNQK